jgi:hypothetical protein
MARKRRRQVDIPTLCQLLQAWVRVLLTPE